MGEWIHEYRAPGRYLCKQIHAPTQLGIPLCKRPVQAPVPRVQGVRGEGAVEEEQVLLPLLGRPLRLEPVVRLARPVDEAQQAKVGALEVGRGHVGALVGDEGVAQAAPDDEVDPLRMRRGQLAGPRGELVGQAGAGVGGRAREPAHVGVSQGEHGHALQEARDAGGVDDRAEQFRDGRHDEGTLLVAEAVKLLRVRQRGMTMRDPGVVVTRYRLEKLLCGGAGCRGGCEGGVHGGGGDDGRSGGGGGGGREERSDVDDWRAEHHARRLSAVDAAADAAAALLDEAHEQLIQATGGRAEARHDVPAGRGGVGGGVRRRRRRRILRRAAQCTGDCTCG